MVQDDGGTQQENLSSSIGLARGTGAFEPLGAHEDETACIVHDLRGPIAAIYHEVALVERGTRPAGMRTLLAIRKNIEFIERLLADLLVSSAAVRKRQPTALVRLAEDVMSRRSEAEQERICIDVRAELVVSVEPTRIERVLANLIDNALVHSSPAAAIVVRVERAGTSARVSVLDAGPGVAPALGTHVFDQHVRTRDGTGAGLGLYIAREIVREHGGHIGFESHPGKGTRFFFELPSAISATYSPCAPPRVVASSILCGAVVLVVDDDLRQLRALAELLRGEHLTVATATSAPECLIRAAAQRPEAVILDFGLCGTNASVLRGLASLAPGLPVIMTSGLPADHPQVVHALASTKARFLPKPFTLHELLPVLAQALLAAARRS